MKRRHLFAQAVGLGSALMLPTRALAAAGGSCAQTEGLTTRELEPGMCINESIAFADEVTARPSRQLTRVRQRNYQPTYHIKQCFSADSRHLPIGSSDEFGSCVFWAEVETGNLTVLSVLRETGDERYSGNLTATIDGGRRVAIATRKTLRVVDTSTVKARMLVDHGGTPMLFGAPAGSIDGKTIYVPVNEEVEDIGRPADSGHRVTANMANNRLIAVEVATGKVAEVFRDPRFPNNSLTPNPVDPDLLLIDRDDPLVFVKLMGEAQYQRYEEAQRIWATSPLDTRTWVLNIRTGQLTGIRPRNAFSFAVHSAWTADGRHVVHHGWAAEGGHWIGAVTAEGEVVFERVFPKFHYGHVSTHQQRNSIIIDGLLTPDLLIEIFYEELDSTGAPRMEILGRHNSDWSVPQASHPHCHVSPDGRWLSYNRGTQGRTDVCVTRIA